MRGTYRLIDAKIIVRENVIRPGETTAETLALWGRVQQLLKRSGFKITADPRVLKHHRIISKSHRYGRYGDLEMKTQVYPVGFEFEFFQNLVHDNKNGGEYDFDIRKKMPYLIGKTFELMRNRIIALLQAEGFVSDYVKVASPNPDPLAYFNDSWDSEYERRRGVHRFERGPDGWPTARDRCRTGSRDAGGVELDHGMVRYARNHSGHLMRGPVYGGINGMWMIVYGPGKSDHTYVPGGQLFSDVSGAPRRKIERYRVEGRLKSLLEKAIKAQNFEKAIVFRDILARDFPAKVEAKAA